MKRHLFSLLFLCVSVFCFARGKQEVIVSENFSPEVRNVVVTIQNKSEADFQTLVMARKETLSDKWELTDRRTFSVRAGESKSVVLDNQGLYKLELYDAKGHKFSKKNTFSQVITDKNGNILSEGEFQQFTQPWQKLVFTEEDFEPQGVIDILEVFFGIYGNEETDEPPEKTCSAIIVNNTGEQIDYISVVQDGIARSSNLAVGKGQCGVLDIRQSESADISLISHNQRVYTKENVFFDAENLTIIFTAADREADVEKTAGFISSALSSISSALSITTQAFASVFSKADDDSEFEVVESGKGNAGVQSGTGTILSGAGNAGKQGAGVSSLSAGPETDLYPETEPDNGAEETKKSFWSWLPWVD